MEVASTDIILTVQVQFSANETGCGVEGFVAWTSSQKSPSGNGKTGRHA